MRRRRFMLACGLFLIAGAILCGTAAYGLHYRGERYRRHIEQVLTSFFGLPTDVAGVKPNTLKSRVLENVEMWLPQRRARIFACPRAVWDASTRQNGGTVLHLYDSTLSIGSEEWQSGDYMAVLKASLLHNFSDLDIRQVQFHDARIHWPRRDLRMQIDGVNGTVDFDRKGGGDATLTSQCLNGVHVSAPIRIHALIDPANEEDFLPEVCLDVPPLPLATLGLDNVLQSPVTQGSFAGRITLRQAKEADTVELAGLAQDVRLEEFTKRMTGGPVSGLVNLNILRGLICDRKLQELRFSGEIRDLVVDPILRQYGLPVIGGKVNVRLDNGRILDESIDSLSLAGHWHHGSLKGLSELLLGTPAIDGALDVRIHSLVVRDNQLTSGNIDLHAEPPAGKPGIVERQLLLDLLERYLGFKVPPMLAGMLPESVEFVQAEAKLLIDGTRLQILPLPAATGEDGAILTVRIGGQTVPLVRAIDQTFDLAPLLDRARNRAREWKTRIGSRPAVN
jgi:hypothetical protein